ncbi:unnamed protein product [Ambrosiozyma monospora]|uniref:Unnamed protein product n=1 Tax=Ambrosiozyma monospora TaxID=43982 RepID=A0ACB5TE49_AMBMO|nr:unnamed protein product [Ambrosiozyma monospora]
MKLASFPGFLFILMFLNSIHYRVWRVENTMKLIIPSVACKPVLVANFLVTWSLESGPGSRAELTLQHLFSIYRTFLIDIVVEPPRAKHEMPLTLPAQHDKSFVRTVINDQPLKIKSFIIRITVYDYFDIKEDLRFKKPLLLLTSLIGLHPLLDDVVFVIIQELVFDQSIFHAYQFKGFKECVFGKSIRIKLESTNSIDRWTDETANRTLIPFFQQLQKRKFHRLKLIKVAIDGATIKGFIDQCMKFMVDWRSMDTKKRSLVLSVSLLNVGLKASKISKFFSRLKDINKHGDFEFEFTKTEEDIFKMVNLGLIKDDSGLKSLEQKIHSVCEKLDLGDIANQ